MQEFLDWVDYEKIEPFGEERADLRAGIIASTYANIHRGKGKAFVPSDFMPKFGQKKKQQPWEEQLRLVEMYNLMYGGQDLRK